MQYAVSRNLNPDQSRMRHPSCLLLTADHLISIRHPVPVLSLRVSSLFMNQDHSNFLSDSNRKGGDTCLSINERK
jgi:hypothetical protein